MGGTSGREIVRDLLWKNIRLEAAAARVVDTPAFQRLRYVRQLGHAFLGEYLLPFELGSIVLLAAMIGSVVLARRAVKRSWEKG